MSATEWPITVSGQEVMVHLPSWHSGSCAGLQPLLVFHGHGALSARDMAQGSANWTNLPGYLADHLGAAVAMIVVGTTWLDQQGMNWNLDLYNYLLGRGAVGKAMLLGFSMGGGGVLRWLFEHPTLTACARVFSPLTNLLAMYQMNNATWMPEMEADYSGNVAANGQPRSPISNVAAYRGGPQVLISHPTDDAVVPFQHTTDFIAGVNDPKVTLRAGGELGGHAVHDTPDALLRWFQDHRAA